MNDEHLSKDKLELVCALLAEADAMLSPAGGSEMSALRGMIQHVRLRLQQMSENDFALRLVPKAQYPQN